MIKNNIVVIHIDTFKREYFASWVLGQKLKKEGFNVLLTARHSTERLLKIFSPNIFIATHSYTIDTHLIKKLKKYFGPFLSIDTSNSMNEWVSKVNVIFGTTSTAFTEAYLCKIPIISSSKIQNFNFKRNKDYIDMNDNFDRAAYTPSSINEAYDMCVDKKLQPKKSNEIDYYLDDFYSIRNKIDPVDKMVEVLNFHKNKPKLMGFLYYIFQYLFVLVCDLLLVFKYIVLLRSYAKLKMINNYNYNRLFHKPTSFMRNLFN